ncbi:MAG: hypothetical protein WA421_18085 [Nitrososphaeraceae archaeon]
MPLSVNLKEEFCKQILQLDNSIRFAGIANMKGKLVAEAYREGLVPLLTKQETELSALQAIVKMATRESLEEKKLGKTIYASALYDKIKRATIPLRGEIICDYILLVSFDLEAEHESIILNKILPLVKSRLSTYWDVR